jgi:hypothetical protein
MTLITTFVTPSFKAKIECKPLCVSGSSFTHKVINSEINSITSVYYIDYHYKAYYKTKWSTQQNKAPYHRQMIGARMPKRSLWQRTLHLLSNRA